MKSNRIQLLFLLVLFFSFSSCKKKKYSCACEASVKWVLVGEPPNPSGTDYYNTKQTIGEKMLQKQAKSTCDATKLAFDRSIADKYSSRYYISSYSSSCILK